MTSIVKGHKCLNSVKFYSDVLPVTVGHTVCIVKIFIAKNGTKYIFQITFACVKIKIKGKLGLFIAFNRRIML